MDFGELKAEVNKILIDAPSAVTASVPRLVKNAVRFLQRRHNFEVMKAQQDFITNTAAADKGRKLGVTPSNFKEVRGRPQETREIEKPRLLAWAPNRAEAEKATGAVVDKDVGYPLVLYRTNPTDIAGNSNIEVYPLPDGNATYSDGEYRIRLYYWKFLPTLSADADTNWLTVNAEDFIIYKAAAAGFAMDWDEARSAVYLQMALGELAEVLRADKLQQIAGMDTMIPYSGFRSVRVGG